TTFRHTRVFGGFGEFLGWKLSVSIRGKGFIRQHHQERFAPTTNWWSSRNRLPLEPLPSTGDNRDANRNRQDRDNACCTGRIYSRDNACRRSITSTSRSDRKKVSNTRFTPRLGQRV